MYYQHAQGASTNQFWIELDNVLDNIKSDGYKNIFLLGDLSADFNTINGKKVIDLCNRQNLEFLINEPTRITSSSATILYQIITNVPNFVKGVKYYPLSLPMITAQQQLAFILISHLNMHITDWYGIIKRLTLKFFSLLYLK